MRTSRGRWQREHGLLCGDGSGVDVASEALVTGVADVIPSCSDCGCESPCSAFIMRQKSEVMDERIVMFRSRLLLQEEIRS
jgi:hypothetical protein